MKKTLLVLLIVMMLLQTGCGTSDSASTTPPTAECYHTYESTIIREATYDKTGLIQNTCTKCGDAYTEDIPKLEKHLVPESILAKAVSNTKYRASAFSISVGQLVNSAMDGYTLTHYTGQEAIDKGYLSKSNIDSSVDLDYLYCSIISGDTMMNPDIPYMTAYEPVAVKVWMIFDENETLLNSGVELCDNLQTCAILIMTRGY